MRITWRQALESLTDEQLDQSVVFYSDVDGELHPKDDYDSKLAPLTSIEGYEDANPLQYVLVEPLLDEFKPVNLRDPIQDPGEIAVLLTEFFHKKHSRSGMRVTWRNISSQLTHKQLDQPALFYSNFDGQLDPEEQSSHPGYDFESKLISVTEIPGYEDYDKLQLVIAADLSEEGSLACDYLHFSQLLKDHHHDNPEIQRWREEKLKELEKEYFKE